MTLGLQRNVKPKEGPLDDWKPGNPRRYTWSHKFLQTQGGPFGDKANETHMVTLGEVKFYKPKGNSLVTKNYKTKGSILGDKKTSKRKGDTWVTKNLETQKGDPWLC